MNFVLKLLFIIFDLHFYYMRLIILIIILKLSLFLSIHLYYIIFYIIFETITAMIVVDSNIKYQFILSIVDYIYIKKFTINI